MFENSSIAVFLTNPCLVANNKYFVSSLDEIPNIELIVSSFSIGIKLIIGRPLDCRLNSGISYPLIRYTFPLLVKNKT